MTEPNRSPYNDYPESPDFLSEGRIIVNEERILNKLDEMSSQQTQMLVEIGKIQEQVKEVPTLRNRVDALERWKWTAVGALGMASGSLLSQLYTTMKGGA